MMGSRQAFVPSALVHPRMTAWLPTPRIDMLI